MMLFSAVLQREGQLKALNKMMALSLFIKLVSPKSVQTLNALCLRML
jgi:hypothetical protein